MAIETTYRKDNDGKMYLRQMETKEDVNGDVFTLVDKEIEFNHTAHIPQIQKRLDLVQEEIADLQKAEKMYIDRLNAITVARDGR